MKTGIYTLPMAEYLALPALSSGVAHTILAASPAHARHEMLNPNLPNDGMDTGTLAHACLLEGGTDKVRVFNPADFPNVNGKGVATGWTNKAIREARDEARAHGEIPMLHDDYQAVRAMVHAALDFIAGSAIAGIFDSGKPEQTICWTETHDDGEVLCKSRPDWLNDKTLLHYKTSTNANPRAFTRLVANMGYDFALAFYMRGLAAAMLDADVDHLILCQEVEAPYACKLFDLTRARADVAERQVERAIGVWARCQASGKWPMYDGTVHSIDLSAWELEQAIEHGDIDGLGYQDDIAANGVQA